jgi:hypothetical protein
MPSLIPMIPLTAIFLVSLSQHAFRGIGCALQTILSFQS